MSDKVSAVAEPELGTGSSSGTADRSPRGPGSRWRGRDLTSGSIPRNLFAQAWPQSVEGVLRIVDQMLDLIWAGFLGTPHIAGIGVAQQYTQMAWTARQGVDTAQRAMVSRAIGMNDLALAQLTVFQAATITFFFWILVASLGIIFTEPMLQFLGVSDTVISKAAPYMRVQFAGQGAMSFQQLFGNALIASGDPVTPMKTQFVSRVLHAALSPLLVFGLFGFPSLGIAGAALAAASANTVALVINARALFTGRSRLHLRLSEYRIDRGLMWQIVRIGVPAAVNGAERSISQLILVGLVTPFGDKSLAAFTLTRRVEMFANLGSQGFGQASGVIVGQSLGAGKPSRAKATVLWALGYVMLVKSILMVVLFAFPELFLSLFTRDPELLDVASTWVRIGCLGYLALGTSQVFMQSFMTAGSTMVPMLATLVTIWGVQQPLAHFLSQDTGLGQFGIAWAVSIAMAARLLIFVPYYLSERWMRARVFANQDVVPLESPQLSA
jgi:putative MATE family efflux protein